MNVLTQYLKLYTDNRSLIEASCAAPLNNLREPALKALKDFGTMPARGSEGYAKVAPAELFAPDYGVNISRLKFAVDVARSFHCDVPSISTLLGIVVNDTFHATDMLRRNVPEGVEVMSLAAAAAAHPELVARYLGRLSDNRTAATALNTLLMQDGVFIHIGAGVRAPKAIQIVNIFNAAAPLMAVRRVLVVAEERSSARILFCDHSQSADTHYLSSQVIEVYAAPGAEVEIYDLEESSELTSRFSEMYVRQQRDSSVVLSGNTLSCGRTRNSYSVDVAGDGASATLGGFAIGSEDQNIENVVDLHHTACHCTSRQLFKYALFENAQGAFGGKITVEQGAMFTDAVQTNRNLLASPSARMHSEPQLEIYCDEVKCGHGATTGQLDERALFYMRSRGIPEDEARMMLIQAFMVDVIDTIALESLRERLHRLVEKRLSGASASCASCQGGCNLLIAEE